MMILSEQVKQEATYNKRYHSEEKIGRLTYLVRIKIYMRERNEEHYKLGTFYNEPGQT